MATPNRWEGLGGTGFGEAKGLRVSQTKERNKYIGYVYSMLINV